MQFRTFPMDERECTLNIVSYKYLSATVFLTLSRKDKHSCHFAYNLSRFLIGTKQGKAWDKFLSMWEGFV